MAGTLPRRWGRRLGISQEMRQCGERGSHALISVLGLFRYLPRRLQEPLTGKDVEILTNPPPPHDALLINEEERPLSAPPYHMGVFVLPLVAPYRTPYALMTLRVLSLSRG